MKNTTTSNSEPGNPPQRIFIRQPKRGSGKPKCGTRGLLFEVTYCVEIIVTASVQPFFDAARVLRSRGKKGMIEMWDEDRPYPRMSSTIEAASRLTVVEGDRRLRLEVWNGPFPVRGEIAKAHSGSAGTPRSKMINDRSRLRPRSLRKTIIA